MQPSVEGVTTLNGQQVAVFSYNSIAKQNLNLPYGAQNYLSSALEHAAESGHVTAPFWFTPGLHRGVHESVGERIFELDRRDAHRHR